MDGQDPKSSFVDSLLDFPSDDGEDDGDVAGGSSVPMPPQPPSSSGVSDSGDAFFEEIEWLDSRVSSYHRAGLEIILDEFSIPEAVLKVSGGGGGSWKDGRKRRKSATRGTSEEQRHEKKGKVQCKHCRTENTPLWRKGPLGPKTLCNACGVRFKSGRLVPEYRPARSPSFCPGLHSNSHLAILKMRRAKEEHDN